MTGVDAAADLGEDAGFTLIELMVVLLILAILLAIAIPTFLGVTGGANDRAAQSNLNTALTTAKAAAANNSQTYTGITVNGAHELVPGERAQHQLADRFGVRAGPSIGLRRPFDGNGVILATWSKNDGGTCFYAVDNQAAVNGQRPRPGLGHRWFQPGSHRRRYVLRRGSEADQLQRGRCGAEALGNAAPNQWVLQTSLLK